MTAEQLHDALGLLPSDLVAETDALRSRPRKPLILWKRWAALAACFVLVLGCGLMAMRIMPGMAGGGSMDKTAAQVECAPEAPAAPVPHDNADDTCDCAPQMEVDAEENQVPTYGTPPVDIAGAAFYFGKLSIHDEVHLITESAAMEAMGLDAEVYDEGWFADFDLLLISLPGIDSHQGLELSVEQAMDPSQWEIRIENMPEARVDCADALLIHIPVHKGHIPADAEFTLIYD